LLWQYAVQACGGVDGLAITHLDEVARMTKWKWCRGYRVADQNCDSDLFDREMDTVTRIRAPLGRDLNRQARLTLSIGKAQALYDEVLVGASVGHVVERFEAMLGVRVRLTSFGPTAQDVRVRGL
jgi:adenylosuccinate synthase